MTKKLLTFLTLLTLFFGVGWAADVTGSIYFGTSTSDPNLVTINAQNVTGDDNIGNTWTITTVGTSSFTNNNNTGYSQVGSGTKPATSITFTTTLPSSVNVKSMKAKFGGFNGTAGDITLKVGNATVGTGSLNAASDVTVTSTSSATGTVLTVTVTNIAKGVKCYYISYTYESATNVTYSLTLPTGLTGGSVMATGDGVTDLSAIPLGTEMTVTATANTGYKLDWMKANDVNVSNPYNFTITENTTITAAFKIDLAVNAIFYESFDKYAYQGGRDNDFGNGSGAFTNETNDLTWNSYSSVYGANHCIRMGTGSADGSITSPAVGQAVTETDLTFDLAGWAGSATNTLTVTINNGGTFSDGTSTTKTFTATNGEWTSINETVKNLTANTTITFSGRRFFLDEIRLAQPAAPTNVDYYLVGDFNMSGNDWIQQDPDYKFTRNNNGSYSLSVPSTFPDVVYFKIIKVENGTTWYGGEAGDYFGIDRGVHTNIPLKSGDAGKNFKIEGGGITDFTLTFDESNNIYLTVNRAEQLYYKGSNNNWSKEAMTATTNPSGWKINQQMGANTEFGFVDEYNSWHAQTWTIKKAEHMGIDIPMGTSGNYLMQDAENYTLNVNSALSNLVVTLTPVTYTVTVDNTITNGNVTVDKNEAASGETVTITVNPGNGYRLESLSYNNTTIEVVAGQTQYTFTMPAENVTVHATFTNNFSITVISEHGTTTCPQNANTGDVVTFTVTPESGYIVESVTGSYVNNYGNTATLTVNNNNGTYSFSMIPFDVTITVTYRQQSTGTGEWQLVTNTNQIQENREYIFVVQNLKNGAIITNKSYALSTIVYNSNYLQAVNTIELGEEYLTATPGEDVAIFTLEEAGQNTWKIHSDAGYLYNKGYSNNKNQLAVGTPLEGTGIFTITIGADDVASIVETIDNRTLACYPNFISNEYHPYFALYTNVQPNVTHMYYRESAPAPTTISLADLCRTAPVNNEPIGEVGKSYTINEALSVVYAKGNSIWVKDANKSVVKDVPAANDLNYEIVWAGNPHEQQADYDQSNWLEIQLASGSEAVNNLYGTTISANKITGTFTNKTNPTMTGVTIVEGDLTQGGGYTPNYYCTANFDGSQNATAGAHSDEHFFFVKPKPQEYAQIVWAKYVGNNQMEIPNSTEGNGNGFSGSFKVDMSLNGGSTPEVGKIYCFEAIVRKTESKSDDYMVYPLNIQDPVPTAVTDVTGKTVAGVKYYNLAGMASDKPFDGVNIIVTTYTDGSRSSAKVLR